MQLKLMTAAIMASKSLDAAKLSAKNVIRVNMFSKYLCQLILSAKTI